MSKRGWKAKERCIHCGTILSPNNRSNHKDGYCTKQTITKYKVKRVPDQLYYEFVITHIEDFSTFMKLKSC